MNTFNTREQYLAARAAWKVEYKALSATIRNTRQAIKDADRNGEYSGMLHFNLRQQQAQATAMLEELKAAKAEAQRQYLAAQLEEVA